MYQISDFAKYKSSSNYFPFREPILSYTEYFAISVMIQKLVGSYGKSEH